MAKSEMPNIPGAAVMSDTLDFVKNLWGSMSVPGMNIPGMNIPGITAPTLSVEELEKKINDLKAVETWLTLNMNMLRTTIQALEVQRGTIITLKSMGASLAAAVKQPSKPPSESTPHTSSFFQHTPSAPPPAAPVRAAAEADAKSADAAPSGAASQIANPAAWWNLLQDQFKQAVSHTMASEAMAGAAAMASDAAAKFTAAAVPPAPASALKATVEPEKKAAVKRAPAKPRTSKPAKD